MTGLEEAMTRLDHTLESACKNYEKLHWWEIKDRFMARGVIATLDMVMELLHQLRHKYDNSNGRLN